MGQHWYDHQGNPRHYQPDGKATTLRHARKQDLSPSTTGVLDQTDKPGLTKYLINQTMLAAFSTPLVYKPAKLDIGNPDQIGRGIALRDYPEWCKEVRQIAGEHSKNARDKGSSVHKALEDDANGIVPSEHQEIVLRVTEALSKEFGDDAIDLVPEATFSHRLGYGGAVDLSSPGLILDYKYKADGLKKKMVYDNHIGQLAAYRCGLGFHQARCGNVFISDTEVEIVMIPEETLVWGFDYFQLLLGLWKHTKKFNSGY
jgi:hypothetical protein